jgi:site-specific DNA-adenine methylase
MGKYGIPFRGSKQAIADKLISAFPKADNFYDLFGGGGSITHAIALNRSQDYKQFHYNEINSQIVDLFNRAVNGDFSYENSTPQFISREQFFREKDSNPYVRLLWSFGNNQTSYLYGKTIEKYKRSLHDAVIFNKFDTEAIEALGISSFSKDLSIKERRLLVRKLVRARVGSISQLRQLQHLPSLETLQCLGQIKDRNLVTYSKDYREVEILPNSVIYCDIPYFGTQAMYCKGFNWEEFWDWAASQISPVFVSEYTCPHPRFQCVLEIPKRKMAGINKAGDTKALEKLFWNGK